MGNSKIQRSLERLISALKASHIEFIENVSEGCFEPGFVRFPEISFIVPRKDTCIEKFSCYLGQELNKENFSSIVEMAYCEYLGSGKRYKFRIVRGKSTSLRDYELQTLEILKKIPHLIRDYKQKSRF